MLFHGSKTSGIKTLKPSFSMHGREYVYLTTNKAVALIYTVNAIEVFHEVNHLVKPEKFHAWYSYGFDKDKHLVIDEYYPNATEETYSGRSGYIYVCEDSDKYINPTNIYCAKVTENDVNVIDEIVIEDIYQEMLKLEKAGELKIRRYHEASEDFLKHIESMIKEDIIKFKFTKNTDHHYALFLQAKFPHLFNE